MADLLVDQIEFCDVLLISKTDLISAEKLDKCLLSEEDVLKGQDYWKTLPDPFPTLIGKLTVKGSRMVLYNPLAKPSENIAKPRVSCIGSRSSF